MNGFITEIQKSSVHDGPGFRTVVFMKGCNMRCAWCHNPEAVCPQKEILLSPEHCIGCGQCENGCFSGARVLCGEYISVEGVLDILEAERPYYGASGGVTISGGEPLCQSGFVKTLLMECKHRGINTALETNLNFDTQNVMEVCGMADMVMCDCKLYDRDKHRIYTGADNSRILQNLLAIDKLDRPILVRTPIISGVNSDIQEIEHIAEHLTAVKNLAGYELLSYHPLGQAKPVSQYFQPEMFEIPSGTKMRELAHAAAAKGLRVLIDGVPIYGGIKVC